MNRTRTTPGSTDTQVRATLTELLRALGPDSEYELRYEDFVAEMPQSGERIRGRDAMRKLQRAFPPDAKPRSCAPDHRCRRAVDSRGRGRLRWPDLPRRAHHRASRRQDHP